jgi:hypothetical protein
MKKIHEKKYLILLFLLTTCSLLVSCDSVTDELRNDYISQEEAFLIGIDYLKLNSDNLYSFAMTKKDAQHLNISENDYFAMLNDVHKTNEFITKQFQEKVDLKIFNPESIDYFEVALEKNIQYIFKTG